MTIIIEDSKEECLRCTKLRKTFILIGVSTVIPILVFAALLLLLSTGKLHEEYNTMTSIIVELTFALLYIQHFVATAILVASFMKRQHPISKCHVWYMIFHVLVIWLVVCASVTLASMNDFHKLSFAVLICGIAYYSTIFRCMKTDKYPWADLRRAF